MIRVSFYKVGYRSAIGKKHYTYLLVRLRNDRRHPKGRSSFEPGSLVENAKRTPSRKKPKRPATIDFSLSRPTPREAEKRVARPNISANYQRTSLVREIGNNTRRKAKQK